MYPDSSISDYIGKGLEIVRRSKTAANTAKLPESAIQPHTGFPTCSVIVCSTDNTKFSLLEENIRQCFSSPVRIIRIQDAGSLAEGYNRGWRQAQGGICIFCHDDIEYLTPNVDLLIAEDLETYDIVGVAGTTRLVGSRWIDAGQPCIHGMVGHRLTDRTYVLSHYGMGRDPDIVDHIQALDGLFFAVRKPVLELLSFDSDTFDGFHFYDLDFTFNAWLHGFKLAVDQRIHLIHESSGRYDQVWQCYADRFQKKYASHIISAPSPQKPFFTHITTTSKTGLYQAMKNRLNKRAENIFRQDQMEQAGIYHNQGIALHQAGRLEAALACFQKAVHIYPNMIHAWYDGGSTLCAMQRPEEGIVWLQNALALRPDFAEAHYNAANAYKALELYDHALQHYKATLASQPRFAEAHNNLGTVLLKKGCIENALKCFKTALNLNPCYHQAAYNCAIALKQTGRLNEAIHHADQALTIHPGYGDALALMVPLLQQACDWKQLHIVEKKLDQLTQRQLEAGERPSESPFLSFSRTADPAHSEAVARAWSRRLVNDLKKSRPTQFVFTRCYKDRHITIGYLSEQFRNAATAHLTAAMFSRHDRNRFRIVGYSWGEDDGSAYRKRIVEGVDHFVDIGSFSDADAARRIHADNVDILVDLMGWMHGHRMGIIARRPAPVQVNYLGYPGTTGATFMDYILADRVIIPPEHDHFYSECVVTLPDSYQVTDPTPPYHVGEFKREDFGLPRNSIVFCSFNTDYKIEEKTFSCWMDILRAVPGSVLWLITRSTITQDNLRQAAHMRSVDPNRLVFAPPLPKGRHLARLKMADIALDTLTVNGHTTTSDTLWAGVPVITVMGTHFASRVAASLLSAMDLSELIAPDLANYQHMAVDLALNTERLSRLKGKVAAARTIRPLFNVDGFVCHLEQAYEMMWDRYLKNHRPESFGIG